MSFNPGPKAAAGLSLAAGAAAALACPPFGVLPGLTGYGLMMLLADAAPAARPLRAAFWRGWLAAFAYFLIGCWWVAEAFMVDARGQGWMAPFAVMLLPAGIGLFWGAGLMLYRALGARGPWRFLSFAGCMSIAEWLRGTVLTGFPWNLAGETWRAGSAPSQAASVIGAYGLTFVTIAVSAGLASWIGPGTRRSRLAPVAVSVLTLAALYGFGAWRLSHALPPIPDAPVVRVVQADVKQENKYDEAIIQSILDRYLELTARPAARAPDIVVWSEGAIPVEAGTLLRPGSWTAEAIRAAMHPGQTLLMGTYRADQRGGREIYFNSLVSVRAKQDGLEITGVYDKYRLVPFGEYLPAESILQPLGFKDLTHIGDSFTAGPPPAPITPLGVPAVQPLICYEALYPGFTREGARRSGTRARWIVNVSNDAWFGPTSGPLQHLNLASYRAIEEGLPMVRATPTGVSAVIDAYGRIVPGARLGLGAFGVIDSPLPAALSNTTYSRLGEAAFGLMLIFSLLSRAPSAAPRLCKFVWTKASIWRKDWASPRGRKHETDDGHD